MSRGQIFPFKTLKPVEERTLAHIPIINIRRTVVDLARLQPTRYRVLAWNGFNLDEHRARTAAGLMQVIELPTGWAVKEMLADAIVAKGFSTAKDAEDLRSLLTTTWAQIQRDLHSSGRAVRFNRRIDQDVAKLVKLPVVLIGGMTKALLIPDQEYITQCRLTAYQSLSMGAVEPEMKALLLNPWFRDQIKEVVGEALCRQMFIRLGF